MLESRAYREAAAQRIIDGNAPQPERLAYSDAYGRPVTEHRIGSEPLEPLRVVFGGRYKPDGSGPVGPDKRSPVSPGRRAAVGRSGRSAPARRQTIRSINRSRQAGCTAARMQRDFHDGLPAARVTVDDGSTR